MQYATPIGPTLILPCRALSNVRQGLRTFCTALFKGGPTISDSQLAINAKQLVQGVEQAGVLSKGADRLAVEKLARYFMRTFKDNQLGNGETYQRVGR